ncbi:MAG: serine/threonine-protein kinase [Polyangiaceae bacterium]
MRDDDSLPLQPSASKLVGPYRRGARIGNGAMADVYEAEDTRNGALVALKVLKASLAGTSEGVARFIREGRALQRIQHERIIRVFDSAFTDEGDFYIAMERLRGVTLDMLVRDEERLAPKRTTRIGICVAEALAFIHARGIVHRDLKPENIFVVEPDGPNESAKVFDFGLARLAESDLGDNSIRYTQVGRIMGSAAFMSPEQSVGEELDARTDVYALSTVLYEMLTGRLPFDAMTMPDIIRARSTTPPKDIRGRIKGETVPEPLAQLIMEGLERDPARRAADGAVFLQRLREVDAQLHETGQPSFRKLPSFVGELDVSSTTAYASLRPGALDAHVGLEQRREPPPRSHAGSPAGTDAVVHASPPSRGRMLGAALLALVIAGALLAYLLVSHRVAP